MNPNIISKKRNEWIKQIWIDQLPQICADVGFTPDWALRAPLWTHPDDFDNKKPIVVCGINPGYQPKKQDQYCRLPTGYLPRLMNIDIAEHNSVTKNNCHRYFGPYLRLLGDNIRFYDLLPMRESSMASVRKDYNKGFKPFIDRLVASHMQWLSFSAPKIVWMHTAWAMELIGCKDSASTYEFQGKPFISDPVNCFYWLRPKHALLLFKGDQLCGTRSASIPTRNRLLRDLKKFF